jgi:hypothetical protein
MRRFVIDAMFPVLVVLLTVSLASAGPPVNEGGQDEERSDIGWVDYLETGDNSIVIDDRIFRLTDATEFLDKSGKPVSRERFSSEMAVEFSSDDGEIVFLKQYADADGSYRSKFGSTGSERETGGPETGTPGASGGTEKVGGEIRQEDGVWTN